MYNDVHDGGCMHIALQDPLEWLFMPSLYFPQKHNCQ